MKKSENLWTQTIAFFHLRYKNWNFLKPNFEQKTQVSSPSWRLRSNFSCCAAEIPRTYGWSPVQWTKWNNFKYFSQTQAVTGRVVWSVQTFWITRYICNFFSMNYFFSNRMKFLVAHLHTFYFSISSHLLYLLSRCHPGVKNRL